MHPKVFVKLKKTLKTLSSGQKKTKKTQKNQKKTKKTQKNPLGWAFLKKPRFFPTLIQIRIRNTGFGTDLNPRFSWVSLN